jgi:hypothetical protein
LKKVLFALASIALMLSLTGCASFSRGMSSFSASNFGSNWIVVQYKFDGTPINCWKLHDAAITNETGSDGIFWKDTATGHLVHISGWYNRVQVSGDGYEEAARLVGVDIAACGNGKYPTGK